MARQLLNAVSYLHDRGVVHNAIRPSNILLHPDGRVVCVYMTYVHTIQLFIVPYSAILLSVCYVCVCVCLFHCLSVMSVCTTQSLNPLIH